MLPNIDLLKLKARKPLGAFMSYKDIPSSFGRVSKIIHWFSAVMVIAAWFIGITMVDLPKGPLRGTTFGIHFTIGFLVLTFSAARIIWRQFNLHPDHPPQATQFQLIAARLAHISLYLLLFIMPMTGAFSVWLNGFPLTIFELITIASPVATDKALGLIFSQIHTVAAWVMAATVMAHLLAALWHHFVMHDQTLMQMLPNRDS